VLNLTTTILVSTLLTLDYCHDIKVTDLDISEAELLHLSSLSSNDIVSE
jgi:uncharacterized Rossmann fold enzyme